MNSDWFLLDGAVDDERLRLLDFTSPIRMTHGRDLPPDPENGDTHLNQFDNSLHVYDGHDWIAVSTFTNGSET